MIWYFLLRPIGLRRDMWYLEFHFKIHCSCWHRLQTATSPHQTIPLPSTTELWFKPIWTSNLQNQPLNISARQVTLCPQTGLNQGSASMMPDNIEEKQEPCGRHLSSEQWETCWSPRTPNSRCELTGRSRFREKTGIWKLEIWNLNPYMHYHRYRF